MAYLKRNFETNRFYHVVNRGVDKRDIFLNDRNRFRFIHDLFEFNDTAPVPTLNYYFKKNPSDIARPKGGAERSKRELLVEILTFSLMPNHYHLFLSPRVENGIPLFMKKLNMGYAKYFNEKNKRSGALFEGRYKSIAVTSEAHFIYLPYYIHLNPLDLVTPEWREGKLHNYKKAIQFLESYRWSSHLDYTGVKNFPSVTNRKFLLEIYGGPERYKRGLEQWLKDLNLETISSLLLE